MRKIRVLIHSGVNLKVGRGIPKFILYLVPRLLKDGFDVVVLQSDFTDYERISQKFISEMVPNVITYDDPLHNIDFLMKIPHFGFPLYTLGRRALMPYARLNLSNEAKVAIKTSDIIYLTSNIFYPLFYEYKYKIIGSVHTMFFRNPDIGKVLELMVKLGMYDFRFMHVFPSYAGYFRRSRIFTIPLGVDISIYKPAEYNNSGKVKLLFVSGLDNSKGIDTFLKVHDILGNERYEYGSDHLHIGQYSMGIYINNEIQ